MIGLTRQRIHYQINPGSTTTVHTACGLTSCTYYYQRQLCATEGMRYTTDPSEVTCTICRQHLSTTEEQ